MASEATAALNVTFANDVDDDDDDDEDDDDFDDSQENSQRRGATKQPSRSTARSSNKKNASSSSSMNASITSTSSKQQQKLRQQNRGRQRRRSSARFLRLDFADHNNNNNDDDNNNGTDDYNNNSILDGNENDLLPLEQTHDLTEMYRQAIRMNAENRFNAANSWKFNLIDHMDRFLADENDDEDENNGQFSQSSRATAATTATRQSTATLHNTSTDPASNPSASSKPPTRVNFTKASCTLDASVKIYSYRVDDVHLTSYKILANLNRSNANPDKSAAKSNRGDDQGTGAAADHAFDDATPSSPRANHKSRGNTSETLDHTGALINMTQLDSALQVDPLFHKMSKAFDEGGAKGLLLYNLGVSNHGCRIVFDSTFDDNYDNSKEGDDNEPPIDENGLVDISWFTKTLPETLPPLVPQLQSLRDELELLKSQGFVDIDDDDENYDNHGDDRLASRRSGCAYASTVEEEEEAEMSIHQEALERSARGIRTSSSQAGRSFIGDDDDATDDRPMDDYGGGDDDGDDDNNDFAFGNWSTPEQIVTGVDGAPLSSMRRGGRLPMSETQMSVPNARTYAVLDAMVANQLFLDNNNNGGANDYQYYDPQALMEKIQVVPNQWAGSAHWKRLDHLRPRQQPQSPNGTTLAENATTPPANNRSAKKAKRVTKTPNKKKKERILVDIMNAPPPPDVLANIQRKPPKKKGKKASTSSYDDSLRWSKAMIAKLSKDDHLLPLDVGVGLEQLTTLFLKPHINVAHLPFSNAYNDNNSSSSKPGKRGKSVGFHEALEATYGDMGDDGDYGGGNDYGGGDDHDDDHENDGPGFSLENDTADTSAISTQEEEARLLQGIRKVEKIRVGHATVAKKVDVRRLKQELWEEIEGNLRLQAERKKEDGSGAKGEADDDDDDHDEVKKAVEEDDEDDEPAISFQQTVREMESAKSQPDVTLPFYFICMLHLANEKGLELDSKGLGDFMIRQPQEKVKGAAVKATRPRRRQVVAAASSNQGTDDSDAQGGGDTTDDDDDEDEED